MPTLAKAINDAGLNRDALADLTGVDPVEVGNWLRSGEVPDAHKGTVEAKLGKSLEELQQNGQRRKPGAGSQNGRPKRKSSRGRNAIGAEATRALQTCATLVHADEPKREAARALVGVTTPLSKPEGLIETSEGLLSVNKTTTEAISALAELIKVDNQIKVGIEVGRRDRRELSEMFRVALVLLAKPDQELPGGDEAAYEVAALIKEVAEGGADLLVWLTDLVG